VDFFVEWSRNKDLISNMKKTKKITVGFSGIWSKLDTTYILKEKVEMVKDFRYIDILLDSRLG